ncbi:beta and beta-prime subunits of DNA dependent RNA-polymerase [Coccomyxa subellipsoidea C-169]|uniref:DNA-directed RNA polymerase subunit n=1 Tax=Coccomyxa subellipsoidea (strain C-169) TaxID=574566 RepID=I0YN39_COCSC|nr:beta and beta-prime subunits of DNA dependent RNA-polymerase [Coccomyxa subellipsoidea C-169]EIE19808.1 beta and beta-prime subunits of DNA dependent RNA-polymerase [Coccomyxa subellipsoidea C-169]|eukprot:XP_005644352.1 beta and beta-prime subunits of DNA dependent RNA-polymerase [Coccomyxa subellipsoidea C-169]
MSPDEIIKASELQVYERSLYKMPERKPAPNGTLDPRLGVSNRSSKCSTCGQNLADCTGHFGYIKLWLPVFHIGYLKSTLTTLQCICKTCSSILLPEEDYRRFLRLFRNPRLERVARAGLFKRVAEKCKRVRQCTHCGSTNGVVRHVPGGLKLFHDKYARNIKEHEEYAAEFDEAVLHNEQMKHCLHKVGDDLNPIRVLALFSAITDEACELLDLAGRPEHLIMTHLPVPPVCIRPSVEMDSGGGTNEDDITMKLMNIIDTNNGLREALHLGLQADKLVDSWDFLQVNCAMGFVQRLKGKQGRFRGNLSGKRVDFSGRTVISPDPNLAINEVGIPMHVAVILTFPERVTSHNISRLQKCIMNGPGVWPGANFVLVAKDGARKSLKYGDRRRTAAELKIGDVVERHLRDGDIVLFNRQPSLHRMSIMAHRARIMPWRTFRFNECVCNPYNADFDGDEMNVHVPQTEEARAEASELMGVMRNLCTPKSGEILIAATQDFLTSAFLLTSKDRFYSRTQVAQLACFMGDGMDAVDLPQPALLKPLELWTGKQLFSMLIRPNSLTRLLVNLETAEKTYLKGSGVMCPRDGFVVFQNSTLMCGRLGKVTLGGGNKSGLFQVLANDFSSEAAGAVMRRLSKLSARFIGEHGFSIGVDDVTPALRLLQEKQATIDSSYQECQDKIAEYKSGKLALLAGCNEEQSLEQSVMGVLNRIRNTASDVCMKTLQHHNSPLIMSQCGSKGSPINIAQMVACVGQQSVSGRRCPDGFKDRTLPHFPPGDRTPEGKGFVAASFYSGLSPTEFFFHTMAGREGLVDTAVKTAETGYMSRRLMKSLEDLYTHYDSTVRNSAGGIVQLTYGDDGLDPVAMEAQEGKPVDLTRSLSVVHATTPRRPQLPENAMEDDDWDVPLPTDMEALIEGLLQENDLAQGSVFCSAAFQADLQVFLQIQVKSWRAVRQKLSLPMDDRGPRAPEAAAAAQSITAAELREFLRLCARRYEAKRMDPGSTVGAFGAQSIGEPGTQMTLKTFHFAGVASMNVTQGVPRIKEIINASKNISTPVMNVTLEVANSEAAARMVKARLERTALGQVAKRIRAVLKPSLTHQVGAFVEIRLDKVVIQALQLDINAHTVRDAIVASKLKVGMGFALHNLMTALPHVIVAGIASVERAVVTFDEKTCKYSLGVEGMDLTAVMGTLGVDGCRTATNHVMETERVLGIEAARTKIMTEIQTTMSSHGMTIDARHTMLLADCMTYKGEVLGITRFGIAKMKDSVLMLASFEKTTDHLFDAALHGRTDDITGVSESIIMGIPMPTGTGLFKLHQHAEDRALPELQPLPLLAY